MKWVWMGFLLGVITVFAVLENYALDVQGLTLSAFIWQWYAAWPPLGFVAGFICGALAVHFFWHDAKS